MIIVPYKCADNLSEFNPLRHSEPFKVFQRYRQICDSSQDGRCRHCTFRLLTLFFCSSFIIYLFMYTNTFDGFDIPILFKIVQGNRIAFWNNTLYPLNDTLESLNKTLDSLSHDQNPKNISNFQFQLTQIISSTNVTPMSKSVLTSAAQLSQQNVSSPWKQRIREVTKNQTKPLLILFTSWVDSEDKYLVHNLTTLNWLSLRPFIMPIVFTNDTALARVCESAGWVVMPLRVAAADGIPVLKYMYLDAMRRFESNFYAFANSDILFTDTLVDTLIEIFQNNPTSRNSTQDNSTSHHDNSASHNPTQDISTSQYHTLIIGRRTNVYNMTMKEGSSWSELTTVAKKRGELFRIDAEDYFITSASYPWNDIPEIVIGRRAYDNWLVLNARKQKHQVIDATDTILAVHQTTIHGNFEGMAKNNKDYNLNLLASLYKSLQYDLGVTVCTEYQTTTNTGNILITSRNLPKYCEV
ncbi:hypothetical protein CHS0354_004168 [Potamilus streckersoni]|uniref:Nucleotide-diphospho-sugar transferase domain-containing protein n=1 Tax=Potamilus streckersoni TaxID=2493646 RepID=A0AAE0W4N7_9BIVA|nr:hypothetical protein CHS0354_004168 [Potamilus streckersoni]